MDLSNETDVKVVAFGGQNNSDYSDGVNVSMVLVAKDALELSLNRSYEKSFGQKKRNGKQKNQNIYNYLMKIKINQENEWSGN